MPHTYALGPVPAIEGQYLVIGVPVAAFVILLVVCIWLLRSTIFGIWQRWIHERSRLTQVATAAVLLSIQIIAMYPVVARMIHGDNISDEPEFWVRATLAYLTFPLMHAPTKPQMSRRLNRVMSWVTLYFYLPVLAGVTIIAFVSHSYPRIPQTLGGGKPRLAQIELKTPNVSSQLLKELTGDSSTRLNTVVRTKDIWVFANLGGSVIVSTSDTTTSSKSRQTYEISREAIAAVIWKE